MEGDRNQHEPDSRDVDWDPAHAAKFVTSTLARPAVRAAIDFTVRRSLQVSFPSMVVVPATEPDWPFVLLCASAMSDIMEDERAQQNILRIAQGCLASEGANKVEREAARTLLRRVGNHEAVNLAIRREHLTDENTDVDIPLSLAIETAASEASYAIDLDERGVIRGNPFQKRFWDAASASTWTSVSAPTSSGKSYILRQWILSQQSTGVMRRAVYLTPTRALVEETSRAFRSEISPLVPVITMPWDVEILRSEVEIYVLTQERLHLLQQTNSGFSFDLLVVDEAQKMGDDSRGIITSEVIDEAVSRNPRLNVVFASPMSSNPALLLQDAPHDAKSSHLIDGTCTVNQNLLYVNQVKGDSTKFAVEVTTEGDTQFAGTIQLTNRPTSTAMRMAMLVLAMGQASTSNLIYADGPGRAETLANMIASFRDAGELPELTVGALAEAAEYIAAAIHPKFSLCQTVLSGVAFHYGPIPLHVKEVVETLFKDGALNYLVCTSTLLEGVNLPCTNIFIRAPKKGRTPLDSADFWNLAGRAGRWGKEYQGNIVCVDTLQGPWHGVPRLKTRQQLTRAADLSSHKVAALERFVDKTRGTPSGPEDATSETMLSFLSSRAMINRRSADIIGVGIEAGVAIRADAAVQRALESVTLPVWLVSRHAGISPTRIQSLVEFFRTAMPDDFALPSPESDDSYRAYTDALGIISEHLGGPFSSQMRRLSLGRLIVRWMRGHAMKRIIDDRFKYHNRNGQARWSTIINGVMDDVEKICRFEAPKYLACYSDALDFAAGRKVGSENSTTVTMMLELGVPRLTDMSLIALGLSRASTISIGELQERSDLGKREVEQWLRTIDWEVTPVQAFAAREAVKLLAELAADTDGDLGVESPQT